MNYKNYVVIFYAIIGIYRIHAGDNDLSKNVARFENVLAITPFDASKIKNLCKVFNNNNHENLSDDGHYYFARLYNDATNTAIHPENKGPLAYYLSQCAWHDYKPQFEEHWLAEATRYNSTRQSSVRRLVSYHLEHERRDKALPYYNFGKKVGYFSGPNDALYTLLLLAQETAPTLSVIEAKSHVQKSTLDDKEYPSLSSAATAPKQRRDLTALPQSTSIATMVTPTPTNSDKTSPITITQILQRDQGSQPSKQAAVQEDKLLPQSSKKELAYNTERVQKKGMVSSPIVIAQRPKEDVPVIVPGPSEEELKKKEAIEQATVAYNEIVQKDFERCDAKKLQEYERIIQNAEDNGIDVSAVRPQLNKALVNDALKLPQKQQIGALKNMKNNPNALWHLAQDSLKTYKDEEALKCLEKAAKNQYAEAQIVVEYATMGMNSDDHKKSVYQWLKDVVLKPAYLDKHGFSNEQRAEFYALCGAYAACMNQDTDALDALIEASKRGNNKNAHIFGELLLKNNKQEDALTQFAIAKDNKDAATQSLAHWYYTVLGYAIGKDGNKQALLSEIRTMLRRSLKNNVLSQPEFNKIFAHENIVKALSASESADAHFILGCHYVMNEDFHAALEYLKKAHELSPEQEALKKDCIAVLSGFRKKCKEADEYLIDIVPNKKQTNARQAALIAAEQERKKQATMKEAEPEAQAIYEALNDIDVGGQAFKKMLLNLSDSALNLIETHITSSDSEYTRRARCVLGKRYCALAEQQEELLEQGAVSEERVHMVEERARELYEKGRNFLEPVAQEPAYRQSAIERFVAWTIYRIATLTRDEAKQLQLIEEAAHRGHLAARLALFHLHMGKKEVVQADLNLQKACEGKLPEALLARAQIDVKIRKGLSASTQTIQDVEELVSNLEQDPEYIVSVEDRNQVYSIKALLCAQQGKHQERIAWLNKRNGLPDHEHKLEVAIAYIEDEQYKKAESLLQSIDPEGNRHLYNVSRAVVAYRLNPQDDAARAEFLDWFACYLTQTEFQKQSVLLEAFIPTLQKTFDTYVRPDSDDEKKIRALLRYKEGKTKEALELAQQGNHHLLAATILFEGCEGVDPDHQAAVERLFKAIEEDHCYICNKRARYILMDFLNRNSIDAGAGKVRKFVLKKEYMPCIEMVYGHARAEKNKKKGDEDHALMILMSTYMCRCYSRMDCVQDIDKLKIWLERLRENDATNINVPEFEAVVAAHTEQDAVKLFEKLRKAAQKGSPSAQRLMVILLGDKNEFNALLPNLLAIKQTVKQDDDESKYWAQQLNKNPYADTADKVIAYHRLAVFAMAAMIAARDAGKESEMLKYYQEAISFFERVKELGELKHPTVNQIVLHAEAGHSEKALALYEQYKDALSLQDCLVLQAMAKIFFNTDIRRGKEVCELILTALTSPLDNAEKNLFKQKKAVQHVEDFARVIQIKAIQNPIAYGFKDTQDVKDLIIRISKAAPKKIMELDNAYLTFVRNNA